MTTRHQCKTCEQYRPFEKSGPSHVLHLLLALITAGLWLPVWVLVCVSSALTPYRCKTCGEARRLTISMEPSEGQTAIRLTVGLAAAVVIWAAFVLTG